MQWFWQSAFILLLVLITNEPGYYKDDFTCAMQYFAAGIIVVFTFGRMRMRVAQPNLNKIMDKTMITICLLFAIRLCKNILPPEEDAIVRFFWYAFYPCFCMLGYYTICMAKALDYTSASYFSDRWLKFTYLANCCIILVVMSNDYHQLMFTFNKDFTNTIYQYGNGALCIPIKAFIMLEFCIPVFMLVRDAIEFSFMRMKMLFPIAILLYTIGYHIAYSLNIGGVRHMETVLVTGIAVMTFWYSALTTGLIAANEKYVELFYASGLQKRIAGARLRQVLFLKLEGMVAAERPRLLQVLESLKQQKSPKDRIVILQELRLNVSCLKKQCLMFLQGEIYRGVPAVDYKAAIKEAVHYAKEAGVFASLNMETAREFFILPWRFLAIFL